MRRGMWALTVWDRQCLKDSERKDDLINQSMNEIINEEGVYRTAPATPGLLIILLNPKNNKFFCLLLCISIIGFHTR